MSSWACPANFNQKHSPWKHVRYYMYVPAWYKLPCLQMPFGMFLAETLLAVVMLISVAIYEIRSNTHHPIAPLRKQTSPLCIITKHSCGHGTCTKNGLGRCVQDVPTANWTLLHSEKYTGRIPSSYNIASSGRRRNCMTWKNNGWFAKSRSPLTGSAVVSLTSNGKLRVCRCKR